MLALALLGIWTFCSALYPLILYFEIPGFIYIPVILAGLALLVAFVDLRRGRWLAWFGVGVAVLTFIGWWIQVTRNELLRHYLPISPPSVAARGE